jgi:hypothetical protein
MYSSKSVHLATVELCTSCSQKADREGLSLKSEMNFISVGDEKKYFFTGLNGFYEYLLMLLTE